MWTDNETKTDLIGFRVHADLIRSVVTDENLLPVVLGVFGDWGGGKSSIMQMLQGDLDKEENADTYADVVCLYFNGWMFEGYEDAKTALLTSILVQLGEHKRFGAKLKDNVVALLKRVKWMEGLKMGAKFGFKYGVPLGITALSGGTIPAYLLPFLADLAGKKEDSPTDDEEKSDSDEVNWSKLIEEGKGNADLLEVRKFRDDFETMLAKTNIKSLVILIDDLDRCLPERIIETLEAIKLFVLVPRTAFVIGADPRIVRHAIGTRYVKQQIGESESSRSEIEDLTKDYLEKLIQIPYHLPRLSPSEVETYINLLACQKFLDADRNEVVLKDWAEKRNANFYSAYQIGAIRSALDNGNLPIGLEHQLAWSNAIAQVVAEGLKGNPRQVKRMLNALLLRKKLADVAKIEIRDEVLAKLMVLEYSHLARFYELNDWQVREEGRPTRLKKLEEAALKGGNEENAVDDKDPEWQKASLLKWLQMEPPLSDVDLRDYFWLARDRTSSTLAGVNMVSPLVRRLFTSLTDGNDGEKEMAGKEALALEDTDREALFGLLQQHLTRHPSESNGYDSLLKLAGLKVPGAARLLLTSIKEGVPDSIPAAVAPKIRLLGKGDESLAAETNNLLTYFVENHPKTTFGKAAERAMK